jgi:adenosine/AMP kinase
MELKAVRLTIPENGNIIVGQSHFIKTVEDIYEAIVNTSAHLQFGIAFNESSGDCLIRFDGNDESLKQNAIQNASAIAAGHVFVVAMRNGFPINVLGRIQAVPEVVITRHNAIPIRSRHQMRALASGATYSRSPAFTPNASYHASRLRTTPFTRNCRGECGSLATCFRT